MSNEIMGIGVVFGFTCFLFVLRHFYLSIGRPKKSVYFTSKPRGKPELDNRAVNDDAWLLWAGDPDKQDDSWDRVNDAKAKREKSKKAIKGDIA